MPRPVQNPPNPWARHDVDWEGEPPPAELQVYEETARSALSKNESPDVGFRWGVNPYRGCYHGCAYCYARPTHEYLGWGAGTDFERRIVVKHNLAEVLRRELARPRWRRETVVFSGVTDCYQPLEAAYRLTRACLEACLEAETPVVIITKGALVTRDADVLSALAQGPGARVMVSVPFATDEMGRRFEPYASPISKRLRALEALSARGIPVGVSVSPIIPGVNDSDMPIVLERARAAGASSCFMTLLRLPGSVQPVFDVRLEEVLPGRARKVRHGILEMRGGRWNNAAFGERMRGSGPRWRAIEALFAQHARRLGYTFDDEASLVRARNERAEPPPAIGPARTVRQLTLF